MESPLGSIGTSRQPDLAGTNLEFFELHVLALDVRRIPHNDDRITVLARPLDINAVEAHVLDDPFDHIVGWYGQDAGSDFLQGQLDRVSLGNAGRATTVMTDSTPRWRS